MAEVKRMNYFTHQLLVEQDFKDEQAYHIDMRRRHSKLLHTQGVADDGLKVTGNTGSSTITVEPGMAIDAQGREIVLLTSRIITLPNRPAKEEVKVYIAYHQEETDPSQIQGAEGNTRITESPDFFLVPNDPLPQDGVLLAEIKVENGILTDSPKDVRPRAGTPVGDDLTLRSLTLKNDNVLSSKWPKLTCSQANTTELAGRLHLLTPAGNVVNSVVLESTDTNGARWGIHTFGASHNAERAGNLEIQDNSNPASPVFALAIQKGTGNVGIGATSPQRKLQISEEDVAGISFEGFTASPNAGAIRFGDNTGWKLHIGRSRETSTGALNSGTAGVLMTIQDKGNVGIGTTTPGAALDINANSQTWGGWFEAIRFSRTEHSALTHPGGGLLFGLHGIDRRFYFGDMKNSVYLMAVDANSGNVGIGTTTPGEKLEVNGKVSAGSYKASTILGDEATPDRGGVYADNVVCAWANVDDTGALGANFGVNNVEHVANGGRGKYKINLNNSFKILVPIAVCTPGTGIYVAQVTDVAANTFTVQIKTANGTLSDKQFYFIAIGRP